MIQPASAPHDVIVVGSGASGGWAAKRLAEAGVRVLLLDAGRPLGDADYREHEHAFQLPYRNRADELIRRTRPRQKDCNACQNPTLTIMALTVRSCDHQLEAMKRNDL